MDQLEYYSTCSFPPIVEKESQFEKKYNLNYDSLSLHKNISSCYTFIYEHSPSNRLFKYSLCFYDWEELL
jgi:hypothetical protein